MDKKPSAADVLQEKRKKGIFNYLRKEKMEFMITIRSTFLVVLGYSLFCAYPENEICTFLGT